MKSRNLRTLAEKSIVERDRNVLQDSFSAWRGVLKERRLEPVAQRVGEIAEDGLMFAVWDRWVSRSTVSSLQISKADLMIVSR